MYPEISEKPVYGEYLSSYINYYIHTDIDIFTKINKSKYFADSSIEREIFKTFREELRKSLKELRNYIQHLNHRRVPKFYENVVCNLYTYENVDFDNRSIEEHTEYSNVFITPNKAYIREQYRVLHVLYSIVNGNHISNVDKNFMSAKSIIGDKKPLYEIAMLVVSKYLEK